MKNTSKIKNLHATSKFPHNYNYNHRTQLQSHPTSTCHSYSLTSADFLHIASSNKAQGEHNFNFMGDTVP